MGAGDGKVLVAINLILGTKSLETFEDAVANSSIARLSVKDKVDEAVMDTLSITEDESTRVETLSQTRTDLFGIGIAHEIDLDNWTGDVGFANADEVIIG